MVRRQTPCVRRAPQWETVLWTYAYGRSTLQLWEKKLCTYIHRGMRLKPTFSANVQHRGKVGSRLRLGLCSEVARDDCAE